VTITPTKLIGRVVGTAIDASMTRTDTRNVGFAPRCYLGGFEGTLSAIIVGDFKVKTFVAPPASDFDNSNNDFADNGDFAL
jgi:hypothetical protein